MLRQTYQAVGHENMRSEKLFLLTEAADFLCRCSAKQVGQLVYSRLSVVYKSAAQEHILG